MTIFAFQKCAFQVKPAFQADVCQPRPRVGQTGGPGRRRHRPDPWDRTLTRRHWKELQELIQAEVNASVQAESRRDDPALADAAEAARQAAEALQLAEETEAVNRDIRRITRSLHAAMEAKAGADALRTAQLTQRYANRLAAYLAMLEDEAACELLLLN